MNKILNALKEIIKDKQLIGIILIIISIISFIILSLIHYMWTSLILLIIFSIGIYLLLKYSTKQKE